MKILVSGRQEGKTAMANQETMNSCLVNMGLANYYGGERQVRKVARESALMFEYDKRSLLMQIADCEKPGLIVDATIDNLMRGDL